MSGFTFKPATRQGVKPLIALYGESNSGKTLSALLVARGLAGPSGKILVGDTESGRAALYADMIPNGFLRADFEPPFSPSRYVDLLDSAEEQGADVLVVDSFSHEWFGEGGVLDMASENEASGGKGLHNWKRPKLEHAKLVMRLLRSKLYVIVCLRGKFKSRQVKNEKGKSEIVKDDFVSPLQDEDLLFEMTCHAEMQTSKPGTLRLTKWSVPDLAECFPKDFTEQLGIQHGEAIARWAENPTRKPPESSKKERSDAAKKMLSEIASLLKPEGCEGWDDVNAWLRRHEIIKSNEKVAALSDHDLANVLKAVKEACR